MHVKKQCTHKAILSPWMTYRIMQFVLARNSFECNYLVHFHYEFWLQSAVLSSTKGCVKTLMYGSDEDIAMDLRHYSCCWDEIIEAGHVRMAQFCGSLDLAPKTGHY